MLRNVLDDYLSSLNERDFDYPLASLLQAMGFYDIHFTHGRNEFGKDFIAKRKEDDTEYQYSIQSKKGNITQSEFRNQILGQLMEASLLEISHPQFNRGLPRRVILVTTGRLNSNASIAFQDLNLQLKNTYQKNEVEFWGTERLIEFSEKYGLSGIHQTTAKGLAGFARFYLSYSKVLEGGLSDREIEDYSRVWLDANLDIRKRIFRAAIEADILATHLVAGNRLYEAIITYSCFARVVMQATYQSDDDFPPAILNEILEEKLLPLCWAFCDEIKKDWAENEKKLLWLLLPRSPLPMVNYLVWCSRILEVASLFFFLSSDSSRKAETLTFLAEFIEKENGAGRVIGDRYTASIVWPVLAFIHSDMNNQAVNLIKKCTVWLCDRTTQGFGLARYEANEDEETAVLLGYPFDFVRVEKNRSSFLATALADLAAFAGKKELYADVVNDIEASEIVYTYWQFPDTQAIFTIDTEECRTYSNIPHKYALSCFEDAEYASHLKDEPTTFQITKRCRWSSLVILSMLLKDRYFPKAWRDILMNS